MFKLLCFLFSVVSTAATTATTKTLQHDEKSGNYAIEVSVTNSASSMNFVSIYLPLNYRVTSFKRDVTETSNTNTCSYNSRHLFQVEIESIMCEMEDTFTIVLNGTAIFLPVRLPIRVCASGNEDDPSCWDNEQIWSSPSAYEQFVSCEFVATSILIFWCVVVVIMCMCLKCNTNFFSYGKVSQRIKRRRKKRKRRHFVIAEEQNSDDVLVDSDIEADKDNDMATSYRDNKDDSAS